MNKVSNVLQHRNTPRVSLEVRHAIQLPPLAVPPPRRSSSCLAIRTRNAPQNKALLGYVAQGNVRLLSVKGAGGRLAARAVVRVLRRRQVVVGGVARASRESDVDVNGETKPSLWSRPPMDIRSVLGMGPGSRKLRAWAKREKARREGGAGGRAERPSP